MNYLNGVEKFLKRCMKKRVTFNEGVVVAFLITGLFGLSSEIFAGYNNALLPSWQGIDGATIPGSWNFVVAESGTATGTTGTGNIILGRFAGAVTGTQNFVAGHNGAGAGTSGMNNIIMGQEAGKNVSGHNNVALGDRAGKDVSGNNNFAAGPYAAGTGVTGYYNIAIGNETGENVGYAGNIAGLESSNSSTGMGRNNIAIGRRAGNSVQGNENIAIGARVGETVGAKATSSSIGIYNVALGTDSGNRVEGKANVALGTNSGNDITGSYNLTFGDNSGKGITGDNNIVLGKKAGEGLGTIKASDTISIGTESLANKDKVTAMGYSAKALGQNTLALGGYTTADVANSVALGDHSITLASGTVTKGTAKDYTSQTMTGNSPFTLNFAGGDKVAGVVSVGSASGTRRIQNVAPGWIDEKSTDAINGSQLYALASTVANISASSASPIKYFSVKQTTDVANHKNDGATQEGAIAIGPNASATLKNSIVLGNGAKVNPEGGAGTNGIAIGTNARSHVMTNGNHEAIVTFGRDKANLAGGIAVGQDTHARIGNVELGNRDYRGQIGDFDLKGKDNWNITTGVGTTAVGDNSFAMGNFQSINGSYNVISKLEDVSTSYGSQFERGAKAVRNAAAAVQGFGASINGTLNSIEANENLEGPKGLFDALPLLSGKLPVTGLMYSGMSSSIVGTANRLNKSNGILIFGTGNEVSNSYLTPKDQLKVDSLKMDGVPFVGSINVPSSITTTSIKELSETFRKYSQNNRLASVGIIGGANKADYAVFSSINGVGNTLTGKGAAAALALTEKNTVYNTQNKYENFAAFNSITGYENKGTNVTHSIITGSWNELENTEKNIVMGNKHVLKGSTTDSATGNIILGFNKDKDTDDIKEGIDDAVTIGNNTKIGGNNAIAIGKEAQALGESSISIGTGNIVKANKSGAFGDPNIIEKDIKGSYAFGNDNVITTTNTFVLGNNINNKGNVDGMPVAIGNTVENSVYLGNASIIAKGAAVGTKNLKTDGTAGTTTTAGDTGEVSSATVNGVTYSGFAGATSTGAVTVGSAGAERRIMNVAAGEISKTSTDAINGSQLYVGLEKISLMPAMFYESALKSGDTYTKSTSIADIPISKLKMDFGYGIKAEKVTNSGEDIILVTLDKDSIKNDPDFKGPQGEKGEKGETGLAGPQGPAGKDGKNGIDGKPATAVVVNNNDGTHTFTVKNSDGTETSTVIRDGKDGNGGTGATETVVAGSTNVTVNNTKQNSTGGKEYTVDLAKDISINSVIAGNTKMDTNGVVINNGPSMTTSGIHAGDKKITNVVAGEADTDAVNVSQLKGVEKTINNNITNIEQRLDDVEGKMDKGFANLTAMATLEFMDLGVNQVAVGAAVGTYGGSQAVAVGVQGAPTENTRIYAKVSATPGRKAKTAAGVGATWRFNLK